jgi:hypothetical protein
LAMPRGIDHELEVLDAFLNPALLQRDCNHSIPRN